MPSNENQTRRSLREISLHFLIGAVIGLAFACIPLAITLPNLASWNITTSAAIVVICGVLSALVGKRALSAFMNVLENFPPIA